MSSYIDIQNACIATKEPTKGYVTVSGWGLIKNDVSTNQLMEAYVPIMARKKCVKFWGSEVTKNMICGDAKSGKITCSGDSGGKIFTVNRKSLWHYLISVKTLT